MFLLSSLQLAPSLLIQQLLTLDTAYIPFYLSTAVTQLLCVNTSAELQLRGYLIAQGKQCNTVAKRD